MYTTSTGIYDLFFDEGLINSNIPLETGIVENKRINGIWLSSGRSGSATTSYFDNLRVSVNPIPEPSTLILFGIGVLGIVGYGWRRRKQVPQ